ncbi:MAG: ABC transporter permease [Actinomycetota bacterium]
MWKATIKGILGHKVRLLLTAVAVMLGVGFVAGTFVFTDTLNRVFDRLFADAFRGIDVSVRAASSLDEGFGRRERIPESLLGMLERLPGVREATGAVAGFAQFLGRDGKPLISGGAPTFAASWDDAAARAFVIRSGRPPRGADEVAVDAGTARRARFRVGDHIRLLVQGVPADFTVAGIAGFGEADNLGGATFALFDLDTAQRLLDAEGRLDTIAVSAEPGVSDSQLRRRVAAVLPPGVEAVTARSAAEEQAGRIKQGLGFVKTFLLIFAGISLFVGTFIIQNTFRIVVAQRTRELALFRALGASAQQVTAMVLVEAAAVGVVASAVGVGVGVGLAAGLRGILEAFGGQLPQGPLILLPRTVAVTLALGTTVTVISSILPARRAARVPPVAAMRDPDPAADGTAGRRRILLGGLAAAMGLGLLAAGLFLEVKRPQPVYLVGAGAALTFIGVAVLGPTFARPVAGVIGAPYPALLRVSGTLARRNAMRSPRRTAATAAALMVGLALVSLVSIMAASIRRTTVEVLDESFRADLVISIAGFSPVGFSPQITEQVSRLRQVETVTAVRSSTGPPNARIGDDPVFVAGIDPALLPKVVELSVGRGNLRRLTDGGVAVRRREATRRELALGDEVKITFTRTGTRSFPVVAIWDAEGVGVPFLLGLDAYRENIAEQSEAQAFVRLRRSIPAAEGRRAVESVTDAYPNVQLQDRSQFREKVSRDVNRTLGGFIGLLGLAIVIALMGIANTLSLSVIERTREIGMMRAVGMSRRQVRRMVRWEAVIIAVFGALLGVAIGIFFGWAVARSLREEGIRLAVPIGQLAGWVVAGGAAGLLAATVPAWRASRLDVLRAIAHE